MDSPQIFVFDVDGVIADPSEKKVIQPTLSQKIADIVDRDDLVCLNTGRSISWLEEKNRRVLEFESLIKDRRKLSDIMLVGEKGATWRIFENGKNVTHVDEDIVIPESLKDEIRDLIVSDFSDCSFFDESKLTMISTEIKDGYPISEYAKRQKIFVESLKHILMDQKYSNLDLKVDPSISATDIENTHVGKHLGAKRIVKWLQSKQINPKHFYLLGDSAPDAKMAEELQDKYSVEFIFVGKPERLDRSKLYCPVTVTKALYTAGTIEFLNSIKS